MSNNPFPIKHRDEFNLTERVFYVADTDSGKPASSLNVGDLCWAVDTGYLYVATSTTAWVLVSRPDVGTLWTEPQIFESLFVYSAPYQGAIATEALTSERGWLFPDCRGSIVLRGNSVSGDPPSVAGYLGFVNQTGKTAAIASTNLTNATPAGTYRITYFLRCTTADVTAGTIQFNCIYTDSVGATTDSSAVVALTSTANRAQGTIVADLASGNIQYSTTLVGIAGTSQYKLRVRCEYLG